MMSELAYVLSHGDEAVTDAVRGHWNETAGRWCRAAPTLTKP